MRLLSAVLSENGKPCAVIEKDDAARLDRFCCGYRRILLHGG
ncbi:hypothetical protein NBRC3257_0638 [Gluconobacter thailandicus NBRC 3257]|uniref:Transposase n=1 Tax=Gluconobacter thailandicus NBRC 3257 TaxID=1381097 RepID=A0ABQ0ITU7_GLUTH|nr:hypothetical protein NBRC3255_2596 [Gluconobacter thailandicus NBRC 3255]GAD25639.1 hypothetical protein NBRC3257_0638 [Gluconobacter thailandicus NBRC 3257]